MKKSFGGFDIEISDWTPNLKVATIIFSVITILTDNRSFPLWFFTTNELLSLWDGFHQ